MLAVPHLVLRLDVDYQIWRQSFEISFSVPNMMRPTVLYLSGNPTTVSPD